MDRKYRKQIFSAFIITSLFIALTRDLYNFVKLIHVYMCCRQHDLGVPASWLQHQVC